MTIRALYLSFADSSFGLDRLLAKHCEKLDITHTLAQATAIFNNSAESHSPVSAYNLIVADVPVAGINLAEYVLGRIRPTAYLASSEGLSREWSARYASANRSSGAAKYPNSPVILLFDPAGDISTARRALQLGIDDYLLVSDLSEGRIDAILAPLWARFSEPQNPSIYVDHSASPASRSASAHDNGEFYGDDQFSLNRSMRLSSVEAAIVHCLSAQNGAPMSARNIVHAVMGRDVDEDRAATLIRPHISRLRSKVEPTPQMPQRLLTVRGKGYMFVNE